MNANDYTDILKKIEENTAASADDARVSRFYTGAVLIFVILLLLLFGAVFSYSIFLR